MCFLLLCSCSKGEAQNNSEPENEIDNAVSELKVSAVWLSCYELKSMFELNDEQVFLKKAQTVIDNCVSNGINTLFLHVRPFCDSIYPSDVFSWSEYALDKNGQPPEYDPLAVFISAAHEKGVELHAWLNPYRISYKADFEPGEDIADFSVSCDEGAFLQPSSIKSQKLVLDGIREILENYDVDGIHIDDYFYPVKDKSFDADEYKAFRDAGGRMSLSDWRRNNVNSLVSAIYSLVHAVKPDAVFSISPTADIAKNKFTYYADIALWCETPGYADWIIPQIYFGFEHQTNPFSKIVAEWEQLLKDSHAKLICGLAAYKQNSKDDAAGNASNEWIENKELISQQIDYLKSRSSWSGYALFSYSDITLN